MVGQLDDLVKTLPTGAPRTNKVKVPDKTKKTLGLKPTDITTEDPGTTTAGKATYKPTGIVGKPTASVPHMFGTAETTAQRQARLAQAAVAKPAPAPQAKKVAAKQQVIEEKGPEDQLAEKRRIEERQAKLQADQKRQEDEERQRREVEAKRLRDRQTAEAKSARDVYETADPVSQKRASAADYITGTKETVDPTFVQTKRDSYLSAADPRDRAAIEELFASGQLQGIATDAELTARVSAIVKANRINIGETWLASKGISKDELRGLVNHPALRDILTYTAASRFYDPDEFVSLYGNSNQETQDKINAAFDTYNQAKAMKLSDESYANYKQKGIVKPGMSEEDVTSSILNHQIYNALQAYPELDRASLAGWITQPGIFDLNNASSLQNFIGGKFNEITGASPIAINNAQLVNYANQGLIDFNVSGSDALGKLRDNLTSKLVTSLMQQYDPAKGIDRKEYLAEITSMFETGEIAFTATPAVAAEKLQELFDKREGVDPAANMTLDEKTQWEDIKRKLTENIDRRDIDVNKLPPRVMAAYTKWRNTEEYQQLIRDSGLAGSAGKTVQKTLASYEASLVPSKIDTFRQLVNIGVLREGMSHDEIRAAWTSWSDGRRS